MIYDIEKFLLIYRQILAEFYFLNGHFNTKEKMMTVDYDAVFTSWRSDMAKKYRNVFIDMHWATNDRKITKNQIIMDVRHRNTYFFEVKYQFGDILNPDFDDFLQYYKSILDKFFELNDTFDYEIKNSASEYEKYFYEWKKGIKLKYQNMVFDILWSNNSGEIKDNPLYFNVVYRDTFLFQIRYLFQKDIVLE
jgi:hypothetical protein